MKLKRGITVTMMVITVIILLILASTITFSVYSGINYSKLSSWKSEIGNIQSVINEKLNEIDEYLMGSISISKDSIAASDFVNQFAGETVDSENNITLAVLDLGKLGITDTMYGVYSTSTDVYAISKETNKVYYVQGLELGNDIYYTITNDDLENLENTENTLGSIVFVPSHITYTNQTITVTVKIPNTISDAEINVSNSEILIDEPYTEGDMNVYKVNNSDAVAANYVVTVTYNGTTSTYEVKNYDNVSPEINTGSYVYKQYEDEEGITVEKKYLTNISATDNSGIKSLKYLEGNVSSETDATNIQYVKNNGKTIKDGIINLNKDVTLYTIYAEDNAGNYTLKNIDITTLQVATVATEQ